MPVELGKLCRMPEREHIPNLVVDCCASFCVMGTTEDIHLSGEKYL